MIAMIASIRKPTRTRNAWTIKTARSCVASPHDTCVMSCLLGCLCSKPFASLLAPPFPMSGQLMCQIVCFRIPSSDPSSSVMSQSVMSCHVVGVLCRPCFVFRADFRPSGRRCCYPCPTRKHWRASCQAGRVRREIGLESLAPPGPPLPTSCGIRACPRRIAHEITTSEKPACPLRARCRLPPVRLSLPHAQGPPKGVWPKPCCFQVTPHTRARHGCASSCTKGGATVASDKGPASWVIFVVSSFLARWSESKHSGSFVTEPGGPPLRAWLQVLGTHAMTKLGVSGV